MSERLILKGALSDLRRQKMKLETAIDANVRAVKNALAGSTFKKIVEIDIEGALINLEEAAAQKKALLGVIGQMAKVEKDLA